MKVSIITATYNSSSTIIDTVRSVENQTYNNIEHIIIDGNSIDNTLELVKQQCSKLSMVISEPDKGIYDALNKGINAATGDVIGFLHSDDLFAYTDAVKDIVETFRLNNSDAIYADLIYVSKDNVDNIIRHWKSGEYQRNSLKRGWMPPHPTFYMKRQLYNQMGLFDLGFKISADYDAMLRFLWIGKVNTAYLPKVLVKMRTGGVSNNSLKNILVKMTEDVRALRKNDISWFIALLSKNVSKLSQFNIYMKKHTSN